MNFLHSKRACKRKHKWNAQFPILSLADCKLDKKKRRRYLISFTGKYNKNRACTLIDERLQNIILCSSTNPCKFLSPCLQIRINHLLVDISLAKHLYYNGAAAG